MLDDTDDQMSSRSKQTVYGILAVDQEKRIAQSGRGLNDKVMRSGRAERAQVIRSSVGVAQATDSSDCGSATPNRIDDRDCRLELNPANLRV